MKTSLLLSVLLLFSTAVLAQQSKNGNYTVSATNTVINAYTDMTASVSAGATSITVTGNSLTSSVLTTALAPGDLILIVQMQGVSMDIDLTTISWGGDYTLSSGGFADFGNQNNYRDDWGQVTNYNNAGKYEYAQVRSVSGSNGITLMCALTNSYDVSGHVQIVRVPRFNNLTLNANTSIVPTLWDGTTGGIVALEINGNLVFGNNSKISATAFGFRGGVIENTSNGPAPNATDVGKPGYSAALQGAEKGEGVGGSAALEYTNLFSRYGCGSPANGGGGGNYRNAGGGGGSNVGSGTYTGYGVPNPTYATNWNVELSGMSAAPSSGGGRGGYSLAQSDQNENTLGPNQTAWAGDYRRTEGGFGGHPLTFDATRIFMGGGGGAGEEDSGQGGSGGRGGGLVFIQVNGTVSGTGAVESKGENGQKSNPSSQTAGVGVKKGNDGAGGGGSGGSVYISNGSVLPASVTIDVTGGKGGDNDILFGSFASTPESNGPGGGGTGGFVNYTSGTPATVLTGGANGVVIATGFTSIVANFPPNGATSGATGTSMTTVPFFNLTPNNASICSGQTANVSVSVIGTQPAGSTITWYTTQFGTTAVHTGATFTTPALTTTTTYYVGVCPGTFRIPVTVTVGGPSITGTASVTDATCTSGGSITGLSASGGVPTLTYTWNGVSSPGTDLSNASAGSYTLIVTDGAGCTASSGPYTIGTSGGPTVSTTNMVITQANCSNTGGAITGITATGTGLTYSWNSGAFTSLDISNIPAGSYTLTVTDNNGCTATAGPVNVTQMSGPVISTTNMIVTQTSCGGTNGAITGISVSGGATPYTYSWNSGAFNTLDITNLASGSYSLTVTDNNGCTANYGPENIAPSSSPVLTTASMTVTDAHCGQSDGAIAGITVSGGSTPYNYSWNAGAYTSLDISSIPAGSYSLVVTDNAGCQATAGPVTVNDLSGPVISTTNMVITDESCSGNDGSITGITVTGTGLTYSWNLNPSAGPDLANIPGGTYGLAVTDSYGCNAVAGPFTVGQTSGPTVNTTNMTVTQTSCGLNNGSITGITASGTGITYQWNGTVTATPDTVNLAPGNYTLTITDGNGCTTSSGPYTINTSSTPVVNATNVTVTNDQCSQGVGAITGITVSGGSTPYSYSWNAGAYNTLSLSSLNAGTYSLVVTDNAGCTANAGPFTVTNGGGPVVNFSNAVVTDESCAMNDGSVTGITVSGGSTPYTYTWNGTAATAPDTSGLADGTYTLIVTDANGCSSTAGPFTVNPADPIVLDDSNVTITPTGCSGNTGEITGITFTGGVNPVVSWSNGANTLNIQNLAAGNYMLTITDDQNCQVNGTYTVGNSSGLTINTASVVVSNDMCGNQTGSITGVTVSGGTSPYSYEWNGDVTLNTLDLAGLDSGSYHLVVTDVAGCTANTDLFVGIVEGPDMDVSNVLVSNENCIGNNGSISGIQVSGNGPFTYTWQGSAMTSLDVSGLTAGSYVLVATDINGCSVSSPALVVNSTPAPNADFNMSSSQVSPGENIHFTDASTGTVQDYEWIISGNTVSTANAADYSTSTEGTYMMTLIITSPEGCVDSITKPFSVLGDIVIPNIITANGDHVNDLFEIKNLKPNSELIVQNRWGNLVYRADNYANDWDGVGIDGQMLSEGVYFYQLITVDGKTMQGFVHLLIH